MPGRRSPPVLHVDRRAGRRLLLKVAIVLTLAIASGFYLGYGLREYTFPTDDGIAVARERVTAETWSSLTAPIGSNTYLLSWVASYPNPDLFTWYLRIDITLNGTRQVWSHWYNWSQNPVHGLIFCCTTRTILNNITLPSGEYRIDVTVDKWFSETMRYPGEIYLSLVDPAKLDGVRQYPLYGGACVGTVIVLGGIWESLRRRRAGAWVAPKEEEPLNLPPYEEAKDL